MSNPSSLAKSSIGQTGQQGGSFQGGLLGSSFGNSGSSSQASSSNAQQSSIMQSSEIGGNAPAWVRGAGAMVDVNRSIRTFKLYYPNKDGDFKMWLRHLEHYFTFMNVSNGRKSTFVLLFVGRSLKYCNSFKYHWRNELRWRYRGANAVLFTILDFRKPAH